MKKLISALLLLGAFISVCFQAEAQVMQDPTSWTYEVKKKSATEYQLVFHLKLKEGWHIWALNPGGDGYQVVPGFEFDKNDKVEIVGKPTETGKKITNRMEGIDGAVSYFSGNVDYVQDIKVKGPVKVTGKHSYQVCNDMMCLPPKDKKFLFDVK
jgi:DsbC/DsbD-like thiol-disulfide interchange protein